MSYRPRPMDHVERSEEPYELSDAVMAAFVAQWDQVPDLARSPTRV